MLLHSGVLRVLWMVRLIEILVSSLLIYRTLPGVVRLSENSSHSGTRDPAQFSTAHRHALTNRHALIHCNHNQYNQRINREIKRVVSAALRHHVHLQGPVIMSEYHRVDANA